MKSKYWIKLWHNTLNDPKIGMLSDRLWRRLVEIRLLAGIEDRDGLLPPLQEMAWALKIDPDSLETDLLELSKKEFTIMRSDAWFLPNFKESQAPSASTRVRNYRKRKADELEFQEWRDTILENIPFLPGVYQILCVENDRKYIGGTDNLRKRIRTHLNEIAMGDTNDLEIVRDFRMYGRDCFLVEILCETGDVASIAQMEQDHLQGIPADMLYGNAAQRQISWYESDHSVSEKEKAMSNDRNS